VPVSAVPVSAVPVSAVRPFDTAPLDGSVDAPLDSPWGRPEEGPAGRRADSWKGGSAKGSLAFMLTRTRTTVVIGDSQWYRCGGIGAKGRLG
jgi:hypothetical protein